MRVAKGFSWPLSFLCPIVQCCPQTVPTPYCWWGQWPLMAGSPPKPLWNIPCLVWEAPTLPLSAPSNPHQVLHHPSWRNQCPHELILGEGFKTPVRNNSVMWGLLIFSFSRTTTPLQNVPQILTHSIPKWNLISQNIYCFFVKSLLKSCILKKSVPDANFQPVLLTVNQLILRGLIAAQLQLKSFDDLIVHSIIFRGTTFGQSSTLTI